MHTSQRQEKEAEGGRAALMANGGSPERFIDFFREVGTDGGGLQQAQKVKINYPGWAGKVSLLLTG